MTIIETPAAIAWDYLSVDIQGCITYPKTPLEPSPLTDPSHRQTTGGLSKEDDQTEEIHCRPALFRLEQVCDRASNHRDANRRDHTLLHM